MDRIQDYNQRKAYVEIALANMLKAKYGFDFIKYVRAYRTDEEFIRIGDLRGCTVTFNVTASPLSEIMEVVCDYVSGMTDTYAIQTFEKLFVPIGRFTGQPGVQLQEL